MLTFQPISRHHSYPLNGVVKKPKGSTIEMLLYYCCLTLIGHYLSVEESQLFAYTSPLIMCYLSSPVTPLMCIIPFCLPSLHMLFYFSSSSPLSSLKAWHGFFSILKHSPPFLNKFLSFLFKSLEDLLLYQASFDVEEY